MIYAIISDIHSNLEALQVVLAKIDEIEAERVICLGDIVGYYSNPNECVDLIRSRKILCIMGNHDIVACGKMEPVFFNPTASRAILWTRDQLTPENKKFIEELSDAHIVVPHLRMVHGSILDRDEYLLFKPEIERSFREMAKYPELPKVSFFGHTHRKVCYEFDGINIYSSKNERYRLRPDAYYLINPGSVGQPRDGDPKAAFLTFDTDEQEVVFYRIPYDIDQTVKKMQDLDFGEVLAKRLYRGQ